jgi:hypothetical protein
VQPDAVIRNYIDRLPAQLTERLVSRGIRPQPDPADCNLFCGDDRAGGGRRDTRSQPSDAR